MSSESNQYQLKREHFGQKLNFKSRVVEDAKNIIVKPDQDSLLKYEYKNPRTITLGNIVDKSSHVIYTQKTEMKSISIKHVEGGWPEQVENPNEPRHITNWKRHKEKGEEFPEKVKKLIINTNDILRQNHRIDVYEDYFSLDQGQSTASEDDFSAKIMTVFKDTCIYKRSVSKVCFSPEEQNKIAIAYKVKNMSNEIDMSKLPCLIWDIKNPNTPLKALHTTNHSEIITCAFNYKHTNIFAAGCSNGSVAIFDLKTGKLLVTPRLDYCHSEAVRDLIWLRSKKGTEFVTTSTDGKVIWWDIRDLTDPKKIYLCPDGAEIREPNKPDPDAEWIKNDNYKSFLLYDKEQDKEYGGLKIEYNPEAGQTRYLIVTEQGMIFLANKKKNEADIGQKYGLTWGKHLGPITGIQRCPQVSKYFLTTGDWTAKLWTDDYKIPIFVSKYHPAYIMDCCWSPSRAGIFFIIRSDGWLHAYDICYKMNDYAFSHKIDDNSLQSIAINQKGDSLVIGNDDGMASLVKLSKSFYTVQQKDNEKKKDFISSMMEREVTREKGIEVILWKKSIPPKDESAKIAKQEQDIKKRIERIEEEYIPFVNEILHKDVVSLNE